MAKARSPHGASRRKKKKRVSLRVQVAALKRQVGALALSLVDGRAPARLLPGPLISVPREGGIKQMFELSKGPYYRALGVLLHDGRAFERHVLMDPADKKVIKAEWWTEIVVDLTRKEPTL